MKDNRDGRPPPTSTDIGSWRTAIASGYHQECPPEEIVAALQDLGPHASPDVITPLAKHLSDVLLRLFRERVGHHHRNQGRDIIERAHSKVLDAVFKPASPDGKGLRKAFFSRACFRLRDALAAEIKHDERETLGTFADGDGASADGITRSSTTDQDFDPLQIAAENIDVKSILLGIKDPRKRMAFALSMEGLPAESTKSRSVAKALGVSDKTAAAWIDEVRQILKACPKVNQLRTANK